MAQIGTVKVETPSGVVSVPVFAEGDSGSSVFEMVKVETPSGIGFIPVVENSGDATFPYIKVQTVNHGIVHMHNEASLHLFSDDFSSDNWTDNGTRHQVETSNSWLDSQPTRGGGHYSYRSLSGIPTNFIMDWEVEITYIEPVGGNCYAEPAIGLVDGGAGVWPSPSRPNIWGGFEAQNGSPDFLRILTEQANSTNNNNRVSYTWSTDTLYYMRTSYNGTTAKVAAYSDSARTNELASASVATTLNPTNDTWSKVQVADYGSACQSAYTIRHIDNLVIDQN